MIFRYGQRWNDWTNAPVDEIDEATARQRLTAGPWFSVSALEPGSEVPLYTVETQPCGRSVRARQYLPSGSTRAVYDYGTFADDGPGLFLQKAVFYRYPDQDRLHGPDESIALLTYTWKPDGRASIRANDKSRPDVQVFTYTDVPVADHWVPALTEFGDWERFAFPPMVPGDAGPES